MAFRSMMNAMERTARNARLEAAAIVGHEVRVLEPSPPAVVVEPFFADDPAAIDGADAISPTSAGSRSCTEHGAEDGAVAAYARAQWLGNYKSLPPVPAGYANGRNDFHRVAFGVVSNARKAANGKFELRYTYNGFGTPFFGDDEQVRVKGPELVVQRGDHVVSERLTTLARAAEVAGTVANADQAEHDTIELGDVNRPLDIRGEVGDFLGDWYGFVTSVLEELRLGRGDGDDLGRIQIWPGHFDPAVELGDADGGQRATYGGSPGDGGHAEPYLYVGPWGAVDDGDPYWNADGYTGASLDYGDLLAATDPRELALEFFRTGYRLTHA